MTTTERATEPSPSDARLERPSGVGVIGLGVMGAPMAGHALRAGHSVHVTARRRESAAPVVGLGATWQETPRELAKSCGIVILMVPDLPDVSDILTGPNGLLAGVEAPLLVVVSSTVSPEGIRELGKQLRASADGLVNLIDAPVSGGQEGAEAGTLAIMVGGADDDVAVAHGVLSAMGTVAHLGPLGSGQVAKACNQMMVAATVMALGEVSVVAERAGLDLDKLFGLLAGGYAGSRILDVKKDRLVQHDHSPSGAARFMVKDLGFATEEARLSNTATPQLDTLREGFSALTAQGFGDQDTAVVQAWIESLTRDN